MTTKPVGQSQNRRCVLKAIIALGLTGPGIFNKVEAGPVAWGLRAGLTFLAHSSVVLGVHIVDKASSMHKQWHEQGHFDHHRVPVETQWALRQTYALTLHIPPGQRLVREPLYVYQTDLRSGRRELILQTAVDIPASRNCLFAQIVIPGVHRPGLYRFNVVIPSLYGVINIEGTQPVRVQ